MRCNACGSENPDASLTCGGCGAWIEGSAVETRDDTAGGAPAHRSSRDGPGILLSSGVFSSAQGTKQRDLEPSRSADRDGAMPRPPAPGGGGVKRAWPGASASAQSDIATRIVDIGSHSAQHTRVLEVSVPAVVRRAARARERDDASRRSVDAGNAGDRAEGGSILNDLVAQLRLSYRRMSAIDRWTWWALAIGFVGAFSPWWQTQRNGLVAGVQGIGVASAVAAIFAMLCIYGRTAIRRLSGRLIAVQLLSSAVVVVVPVFPLLMGVGPFAGQASLSIGAPLTGAAGLIAVTLGLVRLGRL